MAVLQIALRYCIIPANSPRRGNPPVFQAHFDEWLRRETDDALESTRGRRRRAARCARHADSIAAITPGTIHPIAHGAGVGLLGHRPTAHASSFSGMHRDVLATTIAVKRGQSATAPSSSRRDRRDSRVRQPRRLRPVPCPQRQGSSICRSFSRRRPLVRDRV